MCGFRRKEKWLAVEHTKSHGPNRYSCENHDQLFKYWQQKLDMEQAAKEISLCYYLVYISTGIAKCLCFLALILQLTFISL